MLFIVYVKHKRLFVELSVCIALVNINSEGGGVEVTWFEQFRGDVDEYTKKH